MHFNGSLYRSTLSLLSVHALQYYTTGLLYRSKQSPLLSVGEGGSGVRPEDSELNLDGIDDKEIDMVYDELTHNLAALSHTHTCSVFE